MKTIIATKKVHRFAAYFFIAVISGALQGILTPTYGQWQKFTIDNNIGLAISVDVADLDGDTKLDLIVTDYVTSKLIWYQNDFPTWNKKTIANVKATFAFSGDMDGDDTLDVVAQLYTLRKLVWYENNHPTWTQHIIENTTNYYDYLAIADLDNDDTLDVVTSVVSGYYNPPSGDIAWYENNHPIWTKHIIEPSSDGTAGVFVHDIDGDGILDVVATMDKANKIILYKTEDNGLSWTNYTIDNLNDPFNIDFGDIDGDGTLDVVATSRAGDKVVWYENHLPDTIWTKHIIDTKLYGADKPWVTDVDGDGTVDVVVSGYFGGDVVWYENNLPDTIWTKHIIDTNLPGANVLAVSDVDGDGINDVIVPAASSVVWYKNPNTTVAYGKSLEVYPKYIPPQEGDTLRLIARISNPENHQVTVHAFIQGNNSTFNDSLQLFDDGLHNDSLASDNIFGGIKSLDALDDDYFDIILRTTDLDESLTTYYGNVEHFTTIGPVVFDYFTITGSDTIANPGDRIYFKLTLTNNGSTTTANGITGGVSVDETCGAIQGPSGISIRSFGDIEAGESATNQGTYSLDINETCLPDNDIVLHLSIASEGHYLWSDSFTVHVYLLGIAGEDGILPDVYALHQNYPNPFNPKTLIEYALPQSGDVSLVVYNLRGEEVALLINGNVPAGNHRVSWDASSVASGVYLYTIQAGEFVETKKMLLLK